jgi:hypothetical protein
MAGSWEKQPSSRQGANIVLTLGTASQQTAAFGSQTYQIRAV